MVYNVNDVFQTIFNFHDIAWMRTVFVIISIFTYSVPKYKMLVMFMPFMQRYRRICALTLKSSSYNTFLFLYLHI